MARAARSRPAASRGKTKMGTGKAPSLPGRGKGAGKAAAKSNGKAKVGLRYIAYTAQNRVSHDRPLCP